MGWRRLRICDRVIRGKWRGAPRPHVLQSLANEDSWGCVSALCGAHASVPSLTAWGRESWGPEVKCAEERFGALGCFGVGTDENLMTAPLVVII